MPRKMTRAPGDNAHSNNITALRAELSKIDRVTALLRREEGAALAELIAATSWQAHTVRAALTGLRKKGHVIEKARRDDATCYRIVEAG